MIKSDKKGPKFLYPGIFIIVLFLYFRSKRTSVYSPG